MKVILATNDFNYEGRYERICEMVNSFIKRGRFEFYAFCTGEEETESDIISFLRVGEGFGIRECLSYARYVVGEERFFLVLEKNAQKTDYAKMLKSHLENGCGITVGAIGVKGDAWENTGVFIVESEYIDMIDEIDSFERDIVVPCAESGELNVFFSNKKAST